MELPNEWISAIRQHPELELQEAFDNQKSEAPWKFIPPYFFHHFRPDGAGLRDFLSPFPHGDEILDRILPVYALTSQNNNHAYFIVPSQATPSDNELAALVTNYVSAAKSLLALAGSDIKLSDTVTTKFIPQAEYQQRYMDTLCIEEIINDYFGEMMGSVEKAGSNPLHCLYADPLYYIACDYQLAQYICWPFVQKLAGLDNPLLPYFKLWQRGLSPTLADENTVWLVQ